MATRRLSLPFPVVKKSNSITRAHWSPESIWEPRIVALVASKVHTDDADFQTYTIPIAELTGVSDENLRGNQYKEIADSIRHLAKATIEIAQENSRNFMVYHIFSACGYENGKLIARFDPDMKPHFLQLKKQFTVYSLWEYLQLPSTYSQRLFEILKSWANLPEVVLDVDELHNMLGTPPTFRANFKNFRLRVLEKAHKDILEKTELRYNWEPVKVGRSVEKIRFFFGPTRRELKEAELQKAKEEKKNRINNQRFARASACAKNKHGNCQEPTEAAIVCKICRKLNMCAEIQNLRQQEELKKRLEEAKPSPGEQTIPRFISQLAPLNLSPQHKQDAIRLALAARQRGLDITTVNFSEYNGTDDILTWLRHQFGD